MSNDTDDFTRARVLEVKLDALSQRIDGYCRDTTRAIESLSGAHREHDGRLRGLEVEAARLQSSQTELRQRMLIITGGLSTALSVAMQAAGYFLR